MENLPRILVASPTYDKMQYCEKEFIDSIKSLDYPNCDILIVDNSKEEDYFNHLTGENPSIKIIRDDTNEIKPIHRLISSRNKIIDYAIENNYDYILMLDSDVIPNKNSIQELLECNKDIVSGLYYNNFIVDGKTQWLPVAWTELSEKDFNEIKQKVHLPEFITSSKDLRVHMTLEEAESNKLISVLIPAPGFMLVSRNVFEKVRYGLLDTSKQGNAITGDDTYFILKAREQGFEPYCFTKMKADHLVMGKLRKDEQGVYHHPMYE